MRRLNPAGRAARELGEASTHGEPGHLRGEGGEVVRGESQLASRLPEWRDLKEHARAIEQRSKRTRAVPRSGGAGRPRLPRLEAPSR